MDWKTNPHLTPGWFRLGSMPIRPLFPIDTLTSSEYVFFSPSSAAVEERKRPTRKRKEETEKGTAWTWWGKVLNHVQHITTLIIKLERCETLNWVNALIFSRAFLRKSRTWNMHFSSLPNWTRSTRKHLGEHVISLVFLTQWWVPMRCSSVTMLALPQDDDITPGTQSWAITSDWSLIL